MTRNCISPDMERPSGLIFELSTLIFSTILTAMTHRHLKLRDSQGASFRKLADAWIALAVCHPAHSFPLSLSGQCWPTRLWAHDHLCAPYNVLYHWDAWLRWEGRVRVDVTQWKCWAWESYHFSRLDGCLFSCHMRHSYRRVPMVRFLDLDFAWEANVQDVLAVLKVLLAWHLSSPHQLRTLSYISIALLNKGRVLSNGQCSRPRLAGLDIPASCRDPSSSRPPRRPHLRSCSRPRTTASPCLLAAQRRRSR